MCLNVFQSLLLDFDFDGKVDLKKPQHVYHIIEFYGNHGSIPPDEPMHVYFGKWVNMCMILHELSFNK